MSAVAIRRPVHPQPAQDPEDTAAAGRPKTAACEFELITDRTAFDALEHDWNDLFERAGRGCQVFQTFNWAWHWCNHYLPARAARAAREDQRSLAVVTGRRNGRLVLVWPLVSNRVVGLRELVWMGEPVSQYGDVLMDNAPDADALLREAWSFILANLAPDLVRLRKVRDDTRIARLFAELGALATVRLEAPYLDLASAKDFTAYEQRYSPRSRRNRRRLTRRFEERGETAFEFHRGGARARDLAGLALSLKRDWLKQRGLVSPAFSDLRTDRFFADIAEGAVRPPGCEVGALTAGDEAAAIEITLHCKDAVLMHVIVFNLKFEKAGAGVLLLERSIAESFGDSCRTYDLLAPADSYKVDWADGVVGVTDWALPLSLKGRLFAQLYLGFVRPGIIAMLTAMPRSLRRFVAARYAGAAG